MRGNRVWLDRISISYEAKAIRYLEIMQRRKKARPTAGRIGVLNCAEI